MNNQGCVLGQQEIERTFNVKAINFLEYYRIKIVIDKFIKKHRCGDSFNFIQPCILKSFTFLSSTNKTSKYFYNKLKANLKWPSRKNDMMNYKYFYMTVNGGAYSEFVLKQFRIPISNGFSIE